MSKEFMQERKRRGTEESALKKGRRMHNCEERILKKERKGPKRKFIFLYLCVRGHNEEDKNERNGETQTKIERKNFILRGEYILEEERFRGGLLI